jgi:hypothetical protein
LAVPAHIDIGESDFRIMRQGKHIVRSNRVRQVVVSRHNPIKAIMMGGIVRMPE